MVPRQILPASSVTKPTQFTAPLDATKVMSWRSGLERTPIREKDQLATVCVARLPDNIKRAIQSYATEGGFDVETPMFVRIVFRNGYEVAFRKEWKEFVAECILVYDLPPSNL